MEDLLATISRFGVVYPPTNIEQVEKEEEEILKSIDILHAEFLSQLDEVLEALKSAHECGADINFCSNICFWRMSCENFLLQRGIYQSLMTKYDCVISETLNLDIQ
jgi:hypothetical protein